MKRKSKLYGMKVGQAIRLPKYEYGVSHISKKIGGKFLQRKLGKKRILCIRIA